MISRCLSVLMLLLQLSGCAYIASFSSELDQQLDSWVAQEEYEKALKTLSYVKSTHTNYHHLMQRRETIRRQAHLYEKRTVRQAEEYMRDERWAEALQVYDIALGKLPSGKTIEEGYHRLKQQQRARLSELETELLLTRGNNLLELQPVYTRRVQINPEDSGFARQLADAREEAEFIAAELTRRGIAALREGELTSAKRTLSLALRLHPDNETKRANRELLQRLGSNSATDTKQASNKTPHDGDSTIVLQQYRQAIKHGDLHTAQRTVAIMELQPQPPAELASIRHELDNAIAAAVRGHMDAGTTQYSRGEYEKALASWKMARTLDPSNERINAHIARVERVLAKLRELQAKNSQN